MTACCERPRRRPRGVTPPTTWQARENPYLSAYCRWREAEAQLTAGDRVAAAESLSAAHAIASRLGARPLKAAIEALAVRSRIDLAVAEPAEAAATTCPTSPSTRSD